MFVEFPKWKGWTSIEDWKYVIIRSIFADLEQWSCAKKSFYCGHLLQPIKPISTGNIQKK